ncbi:MAG: hypothetical protein RBS47_14785, partial [Hydrogenophaga sp.]|uniref:hypothetical protein n=1 Tax=Hydrogenophaga sp. TaxID=1904254 RepID=UPI002A35FBFE
RNKLIATCRTNQAPCVGLSMVSFYRDAQSGSVLFGTSATPPIRQVPMNGRTEQYMPETRINP